MGKVKTRSGFISLIGKPNVGKSTLLNALLGEKIAIVSNKPQTTRSNLVGILTDKDTQMIFLDTPGIHNPKTKLGECMVEAAFGSLTESDLILLLVEPNMPLQIVKQDILEKLGNVRTPVFLIINKIDTVAKEPLLELMAAYSKAFPFTEIIPISALEKDGLEELKGLIRSNLDEGPFYYPEDQIADVPERQIVAEIIREKALWLLDHEIPHGIAVSIEKMKEDESRGLVHVAAEIYCEKESHKGIIIGKGGAMLKKISTLARKEMELLLGCKVYLEVWVKVREEWRNNRLMLHNFGLDNKE